MCKVKQMIFKKTNYFFILFLFKLFTTFAQSGFEVYQISGQVLLSDSITPVSFAHIKTLNHKQIFICDWFGHYTIVVNKNESINYSSVGCKAKTIHITDTFTTNRLVLNIYLSPDTLMLTETTIYDLPTYKQFINMVAKLDIPDDDYERAKKNLSPDMIQLYLNKMDMDFSMNYRNYVLQSVDKLYYKGQMQPNTLFNVFNWIKLYKAIQNGDFKKKKKSQ